MADAGPCGARCPMMASTVLWEEAEACMPASTTGDAVPGAAFGELPVGRAARGELRAVGQGPRHAALPEPEAAAVVLRRAEAAVEARRIGRRLPRPHRSSRRASSATRRPRSCARSSRRRLAAAQWPAAARARTGRARTRPALAAEIPDRHLGGRHHPGRAAGSQGHLDRQHRPRHHGGALGLAHRPRIAGCASAPRNPRSRSSSAWPTSTRNARRPSRRSIPRSMRSAWRCAR